jgi:hypothetical protein
MPPIELTRRAMYDLVWSKPMTQVAQDFGISDVALKKICVRHRVPSPDRGYWAKKASGKPVKTISFVETNDPQDERILIYGSIQSALPEVVQVILNEAKSNRAAQPIAVPVIVHNLPIAEIHSSVAPTARTLRKQKPSKAGLISALGEGMCGIEISQQSAERVIGILDGLAKSLASRGNELRPSGKAMFVEIDGEKVTFSINEKIKREKHVPTTEEITKEERRGKNSSWYFSFQRAYPEWDFTRTGEISLEIENSYLSGYRRSWTDGKHQRLEGSIDNISVSIVAYATGLKIRSEERDKWNRNWERQQRRHARAEERAHREEQRSEVLIELVAISAEAERLRIWLKDIEGWPQQSQEVEFIRFVTWVRERLEFLENAVDASGIGEMLKAKTLFPELDNLADPPEDLLDD